jgi:deoxyribose-phosphate aldolase
MQFGTTTTPARKLRAGAREAQAADAAGAAEFDLQFDVNIAEVQDSGASAIEALFVSIAAVVGAAVLL